MNAIALGKDIFFHPGVPSPNLVPEMRPGF
jgi:hypothetical protein